MNKTKLFYTSLVSLVLAGASQSALAEEVEVTASLTEIVTPQEVLPSPLLEEEGDTASNTETLVIDNQQNEEQFSQNAPVVLQESSTVEQKAVENVSQTVVSTVTPPPPLGGNDEVSVKKSEIMKMLEYYNNKHWFVGEDKVAYHNLVSQVIAARTLEELATTETAIAGMKWYEPSGGAAGTAYGSTGGEMTSASQLGESNNGTGQPVQNISSSTRILPNTGEVISALNLLGLGVVSLSGLVFKTRKN